MNIRKILLSCALLLAFSYAQSQTSTQTYINYEQSVLPLSPTGASLAKYIDYPVSLSTGVPDISIPLYVLKSKELSMPISMSYHSGGIKVSEHPTELGLGWTLNAGGTVSRVVRDIPDESPNGFFNMIFPDENGSTSTVQKDYCLANHLVDLYTMGTVKYDGEPDMFYYTAGDMSGSFIYKNRTAVGIDPQAATMPFSPVQIKWIQQHSFSITNVNGDVYTFGDISNSTDYTSVPTKAYQQYGLITNGWRLTKIVSADKTDSISLTYEPSTSFKNSSEIATTGILNYAQMPAGYTTTTITTGGTGSEAPTETTVRLKEILSPNSKVDFAYDNSGRLNSVNIFSSSTSGYAQIKSFNVFQSEFIITPESLASITFSRPRLDSIQEVGYLTGAPSVKNPPYKFSYYSTDFPGVNSKSQDLWGYYNGKNNTDMLYVKIAPVANSTNNSTTFVPAPEKRAVDTAMTKKGVLTKITYPTGGYASFALEENQFYTTTTVTTTTPQNVDFHLSTFYLQPNDHTTGVSVTFSPDPNITGPLKLDLTGHFQCTTSGSCITNIPEALVYDLTTNTKLDDVLLTNLYHNTVTSQEAISYYNLIPTHQYKIYFPSPGNITTSGQTTQYRLDAIITEPLADQVTKSTVPTNVMGGGLRVKQIVQNDGKGNTVIKNYNYVKPYFNSNLFMGDYSYIMDNLARPKYIVTSGCPASMTVEACRAAGYNTEVWVKNTTVYSEGTSVPIGGSSGSSISYQQVEESTSNASGNSLGKTLYTFNVAQDEFSNQFPTFKIGKDYIRTQANDIKTYKTDASGNYVLIKEVANNYNNVNESGESFPGRDSVKFYQAFTDLDYAYYVAADNGADLPPASFTLGTAIRTSLGCPVYPNQWNSHFYISPFYYHVVRPLLDSTITTDYDNNGQNPVTSKVDYAYGNLNHIQPTLITTTNSDNKIRTVSTKYPLDYTYQATCNLQACLNTFNQQLNSLKIQRDQCEVTAISNDNIYNTTTHNNALTSYDACEASYNNAVASLVNQYNSCFNQFQACYASTENALNANDKAIAYLQDKNIIMPKIDVITSVNNNQTERLRTDYQIGVNNPNIVKPALINVQVGSNALEARTSFSYDDSGDLVQQQIINGPADSYLWSYNQQYPIAEIKNVSYTTLQQILGNSAIVAFSNQVNPTKAQIDAFIAPIKSAIPGAEITTYAYSPLVGMISATDAKGITTYYEYDSFMRLMNIRDKDNNIVKHIDYHYQGQ